MNQFGDMTHDERIKLFSNKLTRPANDNADYTHVVNPLDDVPAAIDWRTKGAVAPVKDQGVCGSCWTFGSAASLEGVLAVKTGKLIELSEQQFLDCAYILGDSGCDGGFAYAAYEYLKGTSGIATEENYPYRMQDSFCRRPSGKLIPIKGYVNFTSGDEEALKHAVATIGPITVAINAVDPLFYYYSGTGVYYGKNCPGDLNSLDHQVTVVGYGTQDGEDYWIVKNSYSSFWGDKGYIKMARNRGNNCGIATAPNYPILG